jgi:tellurite resistance protein TehA-like permease
MDKEKIKKVLFIVSVLSLVIGFILLITSFFIYKKDETEEEIKTRNDLMISGSVFIGITIISLTILGILDTNSSREVVVPL